MQPETFPRYSIVCWFLDDEAAYLAFGAGPGNKMAIVEEFSQEDLKRAIDRADEFESGYDFDSAFFSVELQLCPGLFIPIYSPLLKKPERTSQQIEALAEEIIRDYQGVRLN